LATCKLDLSQFEAQLKTKLSVAVNEGVRAGFERIAPRMEDLYKYFQQEYLYSVYTPSVYERTDKLKESTKSEIVEDAINITLNIFSDPSMVPSNKFGSNVPYSYLQTTGYKLWNTGRSMEARDWTEPMAKELINYLVQSGLISVIIDEINKRM
jgi:hypothetical protein